MQSLRFARERESCQSGRGRVVREKERERLRILLLNGPKDIKEACKILTRWGTWTLFIVIISNSTSGLASTSMALLFARGGKISTRTWSGDVRLFAPWLNSVLVRRYWPCCISPSSFVSLFVKPFFELISQVKCTRTCPKFDVFGQCSNSTSDLRCLFAFLEKYSISVTHPFSTRLSRMKKCGQQAGRRCQLRL